MVIANNAGQSTLTFGRHITAAARKMPVIQGDHFFSADRNANPLQRTVTTWLIYHILLSRERNQYIVPKEKRAVSQIAPERDNLTQPDWIIRRRIRYIITAVVAASARENVVVLNALMPQMTINGIMRMAGKGGTGTNQYP